MNIFIKLLFGVIGCLIAMFCFNIFTGLLRCSLPCIRVLIKCGAINGKNKAKILLRDLFLLIINGIICFGGLACVIIKFREALIFYIIGAVIGWFLGGSKEPLIPNQARDVIKGASAFITPVSDFPFLKLGLKSRLIYEVVQDVLPTLQTNILVNQSSHLFSYTDEQIQSFTNSYNSAFLMIKDYNNGMLIPSTLTGNDMLYRYIVNSFYICLGWCVFHANTAKKQMVFCEIDRFVDNLETSAPENLQGMTSALKITYRSMSDIMLRYKKNNIDPSYLQDSSKENYNKLISEFLEYVCKISKIEWYDGIVEDFKHCMDEE